MPERASILLMLVALTLTTSPPLAMAQTTTPLVGYRPPNDSVRSAMAIPSRSGVLKAYEQATAKDRELLGGPLRGALTIAKIRELYETFVDPEHPDTYRWTWCGRFSIPLGLLTLERLARGAGGAIGWPVPYATSISWPQLGLRGVGMAPTAPTNLYHFVGYPGVGFTVGAAGR